MIKSMGVGYVLAGHSERRTIFKDDDASINRTVRRIELGKDLDGVTEEQLERVVIAYEPVWAIGTGLTCEPKVAQKVHEGIRKWFSEKYSPDAAAKIRIQYGGSVTDQTVDNLM